MKRILFHAMALMIAALTLSSCCDVKDGDWDPMEWNVDASSKKTTKTPQLTVPAKGGVYSITCKNYVSFWILNITVNNETIWTAVDWSAENDWTSATTDIVEVTAAGKELTFNIEPNKSSQPREIIVDIEAGDTFSSVKITQSAAG